MDKKEKFTKIYEKIFVDYTKEQISSQIDLLFRLADDNELEELYEEIQKKFLDDTKKNGDN